MYRKEKMVVCRCDKCGKIIGIKRTMDGEFHPWEQSCIDDCSCCLLPSKYLYQKEEETIAELCIDCFQKMDMNGELPAPNEQWWNY